MSIPIFSHTEVYQLLPHPKQLQVFTEATLKESTFLSVALGGGWTVCKARRSINGFPLGHMGSCLSLRATSYKTDVHVVP